MLRRNKAGAIEIVDLDDPYHELGLAPGSSDAEVKVAWRRLSARWHPDRNNSVHALRKIQRINRALEMIRNARDEPEAETEDPASDAEKSTVEHTINLTLEEVVIGCIREVRGEVTENCAECSGSGLQRQATQCSECRGAGHIRQHLWFAWVSSKVECTACQGQGKTHQSCAACAASGKAPARKYRCRVSVAPGARAGDLLDVTARVQGSQRRHELALRVRVELQQHEFFTAEADGTLKCELPVDGFAWMANRWIEVPTPCGLQQMKLQRGHLNYRIKNAGLPWTSEAKAGDCIITVVPMFPQEFSQEQEAAIDRLAASNSGKAGTSAGDRMAAWTRLVDNWQDRRG
ncbi:DnaJ domain-containing protein [Alicycliphilus denitrificans]|uniref:DnaJ domain-containing protein n=1 Tax=Alicycliphilus denitrificans TaxID=179636 RepID=A0A858ZNY9_9BURK|nr:DnaJ C-terminal domain-containing protein [Alicycliphilus denitrificans]QKD42560.1 DnaJ domain-containing protein [Alicycliphilus denitrificans]